MKPQPHITAETAPFWSACNEKRFTFQRCRGCHRAQFYPRTICAHCHSSDLAWEESTGAGKVATFTIVHRAPSAAFKDGAPYVLALIDLDEGVRAMMNVIDCNPDHVRIGARVHITFEDRAGQLIPQASLRA